MGLVVCLGALLIYFLEVEVNYPRGRLQEQCTGAGDADAAARSKKAPWKAKTPATAHSPFLPPWLTRRQQERRTTGVMAPLRVGTTTTATAGVVGVNVDEKLREPAIHCDIILESIAEGLVSQGLG